MGVKVREKVPGSGVWWLFINHNGHRKAKQVGSQEAANLAAKKIEARLTLGESALPEKPVEKELNPTVEEYYKTFEATHMATAIRPSTARQYRINFRVHILPELGKIPIDEVSRERVKAFIGHLCAKRIKSKAVERPLAKDSVRMILAALSCCFTCAQDAGLVLVNPATRMAKNYRQTRRLREEIQFLTAAEVPLFLKTALDTFPERYALFLCAIHTGLRSGELAGLQWGDLDFNGKFLTVRRTIVGKRIHRPKTDKYRRVDMSDAVIETLQALRRRGQEKLLAAGLNEIPEWVFSNQEGHPPDMQNIKNRAFNPCLAKAKLRRIKFHDLRHTFASLLIQNGESLAYVKEQLGHTSIKTTVDVYGHLVPGANRQAVNRLPTIGKVEKGKRKVVAASVG